ncbi:MAG: Gfo/Idh/MocA family oxidoreductase [Anaerolineae bacterium]|nr:Gfo/Idh/MocA family oxidoreductase [Anaerolineae bacterium]
MKKMGFGIIGCGGAAIPVCAAIADSATAQLRMVFDLDQPLARELASLYQVPSAENIEELIHAHEVDAVYIAVPHDQLYSIARSALLAGKHALVEKPMALTLSQADELIALSEQKNLKLGVYYELRHTQSFSQARHLIQAGAVGKVVGIRVQTLIDKPLTYWQSGYAERSTNPWRGEKTRAGGGVVLMNTSHQLDAIRYLTGLEVVRVTAQTGTLTADVEVEDIASATLCFDNGTICSLFAMAHAVGAQAGCDEHFDIFGTEGQLKVPDAYGHGALQVFLRKKLEDTQLNISIPAGFGQRSRRLVSPSMPRPSKLLCRQSTITIPFRQAGTTLGRCWRLC